MPAHVWIDDQGQIVRILLAFTAGVETWKLQLDLSDHGSPVRVRVPSPRLCGAGGRLQRHSLWVTGRPDQRRSVHQRLVGELAEL